MTRELSSKKGFMLLEVVLALAIFLVAVVGLIKSLNAGLDADYEQQRLTTMRLNLQSLMAEAMAKPPAAGRMEVSADIFQVSYTREIRPAEVRIASGKKLNNVFKITVTAYDTRRDNRVIGTLWTYAAP